MSSHSITQGAQPNANSAQTPDSTAGAIAQTVDRAAQDFGLTGAFYNRLYIYAFQLQTTPSLGELWNHAALLRNGFRIEELAEAVTLMNGRFDKLTALVEKDFTPSKFTQTALKQNLRRCAATVKTTYRTLADRTQVPPDAREVSNFNINNYFALLLNLRLTAAN
ncbi:hypothetical protein FRC09_009705 [Ceratobasidium sp. 395]|nr:hypothetical protein FRC09_009705 [Ceratobasidium sp. 395]